MRVLPSGSHGLLLELGSLEEVLALYAALREKTPAGVVDLVPAARTVLVVTGPGADLDQVAAAVRGVRPGPGRRDGAAEVEIPVTYDGDDLAEAAGQLGCSPQELVRRHAEEEWTVAFCGFAPGFGYLTGRHHDWRVTRRAEPRTAVPAGAVGLAGEFTGVYPRESPGGWQLIGRTELELFDPERDPPALLTPGTRVRFLPTGP